MDIELAFIQDVQTNAAADIMFLAFVAAIHPDVFDMFIAFLFSSPAGR